ncbi:hypothetical protein [Streptomyces sp. NPDC058272]|uniref:hypothetical protein n=1 Tax=Streptomyces sp. NPDC058272 TaxID=3346415 RepID=UPI0036EEAD86
MTRTSAAQLRSTGYPGYTLTQNRVLEAAEEARRPARVALAAWGLDRSKADQDPNTWLPP